MLQGRTHIRLSLISCRQEAKKFKRFGCEISYENEKVIPQKMGTAVTQW